jgi:DNA-binding CsgD family transcriptional regulator
MSRQDALYVFYIAIAFLILFVVAWALFVFVRNRKLIQRRHSRIKRFQDLTASGSIENRKRARELHDRLVKMKKEGSTDEDWKLLFSCFYSLYPGFLDSLGTIAKGLTQEHIRLCILIRLDLNSREIARITNTSPGAVHRERSRLTRKLGLPGKKELYQFLQSF